MRFQGNYYVSESAIIGRNVKIGQNAIIHENVEIGDDSIICENCIIGEPESESYYNGHYKNPRTVIGRNSLIRSGTIIYSGSIFGEHFTTGNMASIRENSKFGKNCVVGTQCDIQGDVVFGDYCRLNSHIQISKKCIFGNFVFIYPFVVFTNDPHPPSNQLIGSNVKDFSQIGAGSVILPGIIIGKHSFIGANSLVNKNVDDFELHSGNPAVKICKVYYVWSKENKRPHYPWPYNFDRGLPWEGKSFDDLLKTEEGQRYA